MTKTFRTDELATIPARIRKHEHRARRQARRLVQNDFACAYLLGHVTDEGEQCSDPMDSKAVQHALAALTRGQ